jgi:glutamate racemase
MKYDSRPIGVFDSGLGGISVLSALFDRLPNERFLYYGDNANAPYGTKTKDEVLTLCQNAAKKLLLSDVKAIVIACNTATAAAAAALREEYPHLPIIGVEPAVKPAVLSGDHPKVLIMATPMTLHLDKFLSLEKELSPLADIRTLPCPGLVEYIEKEALDCPETEAFLRDLLKEHLADPPDAVVLGCTHYPFVRPLLQKLFPSSTAFFDGADGTAKQLSRRLCEEGLAAPKEQTGSVSFQSSLESDEVKQRMLRFFKTAKTL